MNRRSLRLKLVAGLGMTLALLVLPAAATNAQSVSAQKRRSSVCEQRPGRTAKSLCAVNVTGADGLPASGAVSIVEGDANWLGGVGPTGQATSVFDPSRRKPQRCARSTAVTPPICVRFPQDPACAGSPRQRPASQLSLAPVSPAALPMVLTAGNAGTHQRDDNAGESVRAYIADVRNALVLRAAKSGVDATSVPATWRFCRQRQPAAQAGSPASACPPSARWCCRRSRRTSRFTGCTNGNGTGSVAMGNSAAGILGLGGLAWGARRRAWLSRYGIDCAGSPGYHARHDSVQSALLLLQPRSRQRSAHAVRHLHSDRDWAIQRRHYRT